MVVAVIVGLLFIDLPPPPSPSLFTFGKLNYIIFMLINFCKIMILKIVCIINHKNAVSLFITCPIPLSVCLPAYQSICMSVCLHAHSPVCTSVCLFVYLSELKNLWE